MKLFINNLSSIEKLLSLSTFLIFIVLWFFWTNLVLNKETEEEIPEVVIETSSWEIIEEEVSLFNEDEQWNIHFLISWLPTSPENKNNMVVYTKVNRDAWKVSFINLDHRTTFNQTKILNMSIDTLALILESKFRVDKIYKVWITKETIEKMIQSQWWEISFWSKKTFNSAIKLEKEITTFIWENWKKQQMLQNILAYYLLWAKNPNWFDKELVSFTELTDEQIAEYNSTVDLEKMKIENKIFSISDRPTFYSKNNWINYLTVDWINTIKKINTN